MTDLEKEILQIIESATCRKYCAKLKVTYEPDPSDCPSCDWTDIFDANPRKSGFYTLLLYMNQEQAPMVIAKQGTLQEFKDFIRTEIKSRKMESAKFWKLVKVDDLDDETWTNY